MMAGKEKLLSEAEKRIFSLGVDDTASQLSHTNMTYGLAKIIYTLRCRGIDEGETFCVSSPDSTITRNFKRWKNGFGYGGVINWPKANDIIFPEVMPNACGMILSKLPDGPQSYKKILRRIHEVQDSRLVVEGIRVKWDIGSGNHFIEVHEVIESNLEKLPVGSYTVLLHTSGSELKQKLYEFEDICEWEETPFGRCYVLEGKEARDYFRMYKRVETFSKEKRKRLLKEIFGEYELICNVTHQGLYDTNVMRLGVYDSTDKSTCPWNMPLFPVALRWDIPVYLVQGKPNLSRDIMEKRGFYERADELGLTDQIMHVNILPHGGGYKLIIKYEDVGLETMRGSRFFHMSIKGKKLVFSNPREMPYIYRGKKVYNALVKAGLGEPVAKLKQLYTFHV